jgi:hypothetical protein
LFLHCWQRCAALNLFLPHRDGTYELERFIPMNQMARASLSGNAIVLIDRIDGV